MLSARSRRAWASLALAALTSTGCAPARDFPAAPILLICPWAAGGGTDRVARQLATQLEHELGVPVNVVNATGGDGVTGHSRGALARADGYTMTLVTVEITTLHWRQMTSIGPADFMPLALINRDPAAIVVRQDAPWHSVQDLEAAIRAAPGTLRASGTATAGIWHLGLAGWLTTVGLGPTDVTWVSIAGAAPSLTELLAGGIDIVACSLAEAQALLDAGRVRSLGLMADQRAARFPSVPTLAEQGVDFTLGTIRGVALPRGVPEDRVRILADAVRRVATSDEFRGRLSGGGFTPAYEDPARFATTLRETDARLGHLLQSPAFARLDTPRIGPMFFPAAIAVALAGVTIGLAFRRRSPADVNENIADDERPSRMTWRSVEPLIWIGAYVLLAEWLGFIVVAGVLLLLYLVRLGTRPLVASLVTLGVVPAAYYVFAVLLRVSLPHGLLGW